MLKTFLSALIVAAAFVLAACSPKFDWRQIQGTTTPYSALMPAKPATFTRQVNLDGVQANMTMTATEVDGISFAIGSAKLADAAQARHALNAMKTAMINNIGGTIRRETSSDLKLSLFSVDIEAIGTAGGASKILHARFVAKNDVVYQAIILGPEKGIPDDVVDTFFSAFKIN